MNIILETLEKKLVEVKKKRDKLHNEIHRDYLLEVIDIQKQFQQIIKEHGITSQEAIDFANENADKEKELMKQAKYMCKNHIKLLNQEFEYDRQIRELSNEICLHKMRNDR